MWIPVQVQMLQLSSESQESPGILSWLVTASLQGMSPSSATWLWLISSTSALLASSVQPRCSPQNFLNLDIHNCIFDMQNKDREALRL